MRIAVLPGDGIGPEITRATVEALQCVNESRALGLVLETHEIGFTSLKTKGSTLPGEVIEACRAAQGILMGPVSHLDYPPRSEGGINPSGELRVALDLFANIRPARSRPALPHWGRTPMDLVIVRENTEGFYSDRNMHQGIGEFMPAADMALSIRKITARASERIARSAFELARGRSAHVTAVHKANVLKVSDGLFLAEVRKVRADFPGVAYEEQLVDSMAAMLVRDAARYDVIVTTNMFGDILSDEAAELSGSLGLGPSINASDEHCMAQAAHGSAPDIAGKDLANPTALILSAAMLLGWLGRHRGRSELVEAQGDLEDGVEALIADPATRTQDLGGTMGTRAFTQALCKRLRTRA